VLALPEAGEMIAALTADTARALLARTQEEPATASDLADAVGTSLQNTQYHLERLREAGLVEVVDTWYSERGTEMSVYAAANDPLVIVAGAPGAGADIEREMSDADEALTLGAAD